MKAKVRIGGTSFFKRPLGKSEPAGNAWRGGGEELRKKGKKKT